MSLPEPFEWIEREQIRHALEHYENPCLFYFADPDGNLCQLINPSVGKVAQKHSEKFDFLGINIKENRDITYELKVMQAPSFLIIRNGSEVRRMSDVEYDKEFQSTFKDFLVGELLLNNDDFDFLTDMNYFDALDDWFGHNLVAFLEPANEMNWKIEDALEEMQESYPSEIRVRVINVEQNEELPSFYNLEEFPSLLAIKDGSVKGEWSPVEDLDQFKSECRDLIESKVT